MNLKKVELHGLKSFADKTEIEFTSNVTAIVGPNGCGKSNVTDAIRWVLGEQRPTMLRCSRMTDIIFNGTATRKPLGYAEVSIHLDNSGKIYPSEFDEIIITRKIYKDGENEYFINKQQVRQRDLLEFLRGSGVGRDGYSIIGQDRVKDILKSNDVRRRVFDEAAGIGSQKAKKEDAERRLLRAEDHRTRLWDRVSMLESTLLPLEKEAQDAIKYKNLKAQLKYLDVSLFLHQCENSSSQRERIRARIEKTIKEILSNEEIKLSTEASYNLAMQDLHNSSAYSDRLRDERTEILVGIQKRETLVAGASSDLKNMRERAKETADTIIALEARLRDRNDQISEAMALYNEKNLLLAEKKKSYEIIREETEILASSVDRQERAIEASHAILKESMGKLAELGIDHAKLEIERKVAEDEIDRNKETCLEKKAFLNRITKDTAELNEKREKLSEEKQDRIKEKFSADKNHADALRELKETTARLSIAQNNISAIRAQIEMVKTNLENYGHYDQAVQSLMKYAKTNHDAGKRIHGTVAELISVPKNIQLAIEIAIGASALQNIVVDKPEDASVLLDIVKRGEARGRVTFLPLSVIRPSNLQPEYSKAIEEKGALGICSNLIKYDQKYANIVSHLLGRTLLVETKEQAVVISKRYSQGFRIVTLEGEVFATSGAISGGNYAGKGSRFLPQETLLEDLNKRLKTTEKDKEMLSADINDLTLEGENLEKAVGVIVSRIQKLDLEIENLNARLLGLANEASIYKVEIDKINLQDKLNEEKILLLSAQIISASKNKDDLSTSQSGTDDFIAETKNRFLADKQKRDDSMRASTSALMEITALENTVQNVQNEISVAKSDIAQTTQALLDSKARIHTTSAQIEEAEKRIDITAGSYEEQQKASELTKQIDKIKEHRETLSVTMKELSEKKDAVMASLSELNETKIREESRLEQLELSIETMSTRIHEEYDMNYDSSTVYMEAMEGTEFIFIPEKAQQEATALRRRIERMGSVNALAEEQYEKTKADYESESKQHEDVLNTISDLQKLISELTTDMSRRFYESFNIINKNFDEQFKDLFNGGSAHIELEKGVHVLEAQIEIKAQPPGKRVASTELLSGGEHALVAIALLFAMIKLKPMPFSILDEIDSPLDEANAGLLAQYLKKFSKFTQFIIVTHKKPTMTLADALYGVTMEEKGVSKTVSIELADAHKIADEMALQESKTKNP
ncbi:MAG: chromosome segregation protein SMC [Firmicutes bacterium]|nr:chromosome segregation protein SMC [Bacillota bacterium]